MPKVYNKRTDVIPEGAVYVGRPSRWGNPYKIKEHSLEEQNRVIGEFRKSLSEKDKEEIRRTLKGKDLVCWCAPLPCHADVLLEIANES